MKLKLSDIYELQMGKTPARKEPSYWNGNHAWVSISDLSAGGKYIGETKECITDVGITESGIKLVPKGTLMMSFKLSLGKVAIAANDLYTNEAIMAFKDRKKYPVDRDYMYYQLQAIDWSAYTKKAVKGATLNKATLSDVVVSLPSMEEQVHVRELLTTVDKAIDIAYKQTDLINELIQSRFVELFGEILDKGIPLAQIAEVTGGLTKNSKRNTLPKQMPYLRVANVLFNQLDLSEVLTIGVKDNEIEKTTLCKGDLLFVEGNGSVEQIGRVAVWDGSIEPCLHQNHLIKARFNSEKINPVYALFYFMSQKGRAQIVRRAVSTSGLHTLSVGKIESLELPVPPIEKQNQFADFVAQTDKSKLTIQKSMDNLRELRDSLLQEYFG